MNEVEKSIEKSEETEEKHICWSHASPDAFLKAKLQFSGHTRSRTRLSSLNAFPHASHALRRTKKPPSAQTRLQTRVTGQNACPHASRSAKLQKKCLPLPGRV